MPVENSQVHDYPESTFVFLYLYFLGDLFLKAYVTSDDLSITRREEINNKGTSLNSIKFLDSKIDLTYSHFPKDFSST